MNENPWKVVGFIVAGLLGGLWLGALVDGAFWRADCNAIGAHKSGPQVYDCKPRPK